MVLVCCEQLVKIVLEVVGDLGMVLEGFLWIGIEVVVCVISNIVVGIIVLNFIGIKFNNLEEIIGEYRSLLLVFGKNQFKKGFSLFFW